LHLLSATASKAQATTIWERRETSECFNRNEGNGQLWPLGLRLAILKTPTLANLASPISRALRTRPIPATLVSIMNLIEGHSAQGKPQIQPSGTVTGIFLMMEQIESKDLCRRNSEWRDDGVIFNHPA
jgi:hypothetical protein